MSYFATSIDAAASLAPVSVDRLAQVLDDAGLNVGYCEDRSRLGGFWGQHLVEFCFHGKASSVLRIQACWGRPLSADHRADVLDWVNAYNLEWIWPKMYVDRNGEDLVVMAEHAVSYECGASDEQLFAHVRCAVSAALDAFGRLDDTFPQAVDDFRAQHPDWPDQ
ncbi:MAG: YbjN domain-containing protein [Micrococcales bacterium]|nr:YbjN domain-containing protein [Micrococcales bacterium]